MADILLNCKYCEIQPSIMHVSLLFPSHNLHTLDSFVTVLVPEDSKLSNACLQLIFFVGKMHGENSMTSVT